MKERLSVLAVIAFIMLMSIPFGVQMDPTKTGTSSTDQISPRAPDHELSARDRQIPFLSPGFIENRGQIKDDTVLFYINAPQGRLSLLKCGILITLIKHNLPGIGLESPGYSNEISDFKMESMKGIFNDPPQFCNVMLVFQGALQVHPVGQEMSTGYHSFFIGNDPSRWVTEVPEYRCVIYKDLYEGIDLVYKMSQGRLKYEFHLSPHANPDQIAFRVEGGSIERSSDSSSIVIGTSLGAIIDAGLEIFYENDSNSKIKGSFRSDERGYGFNVNQYDTDSSIIIDPYIYSTFFGGSSVDEGYVVRLDAAGDIYVGGMTASDDLPSTPGAFQEDYNGDGASPYEYADIFVAKFGSDGKALKFSTYIGTANTHDWLRDMEIDQDGNIFICGVTRGSDFPTTEGAFQRDPGPLNSRGFVTKLNPYGTRLIYSTYLGAKEKSDFACSLEIDADGYAYVAGHAESPNFPTTPGAYQTTMIEGCAYIAKLDRAGSSLVYSTMLGGCHSDQASAIALANDGTVYVTGATRSQDFPITHELLERYTPGTDDVFISRISKDGNELEYSIVFGCKGEEIGRGIVIDDEGSVYVTGTTRSSDFPITDGAIQPSFGGGYSDMFVLKIDVKNNTVVYSTYLGGSENEWEPWDGNSVGFQVDAEGNACLIGYTNSTDFPVTTEAFQPGYGGGSCDAFISVIARDGRSFIHSTYLGGTDYDRGFGIDLDHRSVVFVTGCTASHEFPTSPDAYQRSHDAEFREAFIMFFDFIAPHANAGSDLLLNQHETAEFDGTGSTDNLGIENWTWTFDDGRGAITLHGPRPSHVFHDAGTFEVILNVTDAGGNWAIDWVNVTVRDSTRPVAVAGPDIFIDQFTTAWFNGSSSWDNVGIVNHSWRFEYGNRSILLDGINASFNFDFAGVFTVELNVSDAAGNWAVDVLEVWVRDVTGPIANAGPDRAIDQHQTMVFDGTGSSDNVAVIDWIWKFRYNWSYFKLYGPTPEFIFHIAGVYIVTLEVYDAEGNRGVDYVTVTVRDITPPVANAGSDRIVRQGDVVPLDGSGSWDDDRIIKWKWTFNYREVLVEISGERQFFVFQDSGKYSINLEVVDASGNIGKDMLNVTVLDITPPRADAGQDRVVELGQTVTFEGRGSDDDVGIVGWSWSFKDGTETIRLEGPIQSHIFRAIGEHVVVLNVTDGAGNWATDVMTIRVVDAMDPTARAGENVTIMKGENIHFYGLNSSDNLEIVSYSWFFEYNDTMVVLEGGVVNFTFEIPGIYKAHLRVVDAAGNFGTDELTVTVLPLDNDEPQEPRKRTNPSPFILFFLCMLILLISILYIRYRKRM